MMDERILSSIADAVHEDVFLDSADVADSLTLLYVPELGQILRDYQSFTPEMLDDAFEKVTDGLIHGYAQELADGKLSSDDLLWITRQLNEWFDPMSTNDIIDYFDYLVENEDRLSYVSWPQRG